MVDSENIINKIASIHLDQRVTRRALIATTAGGLLLTSKSAKAQVEIEPPKSPDKPIKELSSEQIAAQYYRRNLEKKYGFSLLLIKEYFQKAPEYMRIGDGVGSQEWTLEQLIMLDDFYDVLPDVFVHPQQRIPDYKQPLTIVLNNTRLNCISACAAKSPFPTIRLSENLFRNRLSCFDGITHEEGHILTPEVWNAPSPEMDAIFDGSYQAAQPAMVGKLESLEEKLQAEIGNSPPDLLTPTQSERKAFYRRMRYGLITNDPVRAEFPSEFVANLSTYYAHGKGYFHAFLGEMFSSDQVKQLYDFCQKRFYGNIEYDHLPIAV